MLEHRRFMSSLPTEVQFGLQIVQQELANEIKKADKKKVFIITDEGLVKSGLIKPITESLKNHDIATFVYTGVEPNPQAPMIMQGANKYEESDSDMMLAIGGGSSIDFAKAVGVVASHSGHILDYRRGGKSTITKPIPLLFAIPTTVGTGSEVTAVSIVTDKQAGRKYGVASPLLAPAMAFIDPELTLTLPQHLVAATAIDALVHAIEAFTSNRATPFSDALALQAIHMLHEHLQTSYTQLENVEARAQIHLASTIAGMAFSLAGLCLVHSCSHPLSAIYDAVHGVANAVLLPYVMEYNLESDYRKFAHIARIFNPYLKSKDDQMAAKELPNLLQTFTESLNIPKDFRFLGIDVTDEVIDRLADDAMDDQGTIPNNPRKVYKEDVIAIYNKVLPRSD